VYILQNTVTKRYYIGSTNNIERRLSEHNRGQTPSTRHQGTWTVVYSEAVNSNKEAKGRERQIKSYKGGNAFKKLIER
jgi:putative endonuclease